MKHQLLLSLLVSAITMFPSAQLGTTIVRVGHAQSETVTDTVPPEVTPAAEVTPPAAEMPPVEAVLPSVTMSFDPASGTLTAGEAINLNLIVASGEQVVVGVQMHIKYDPTRLMPVASDGTPAGALMADGTTVNPVTPAGPLSEALLNQLDSGAGRIDYAAGSIVGSGTGTFPVGTVRFLSLAGTGGEGTAVQIVNEGPLPTNVATDQGSAPVNMGETRLIILGDAPTAPAPSNSSTPPADMVPAE
jgi:hypothetical protein